ncbi:helix-turn-helix transcriptional regulator [Staphylococcus saprophyticus]|nr:helix-turn-helix transcriptional regulator [Staphylococcus saprophyticus]
MHENDKVQNLANIFMKARKDKNLTLRQVAYKSNLSATYISELERGLRSLPSPERLKSLSDAFKLDYEYLMQQAGYLEKDKEGNNDPYDILMFSDKEAFESLSEDERNRILNSLRDQADYLIDKAKRGK